MTQTMQTNEGNKTIPEIMDRLMYGSYSANRDNGMTHEQLLSIGIGNDEMKNHYEKQKTDEQ